MNDKDIRLYKSTGKFKENPVYTSEELMNASIDDMPATALEVMAGKVVKFMLTSRGSDAMDKNYGSYLTIPHQVSQEYVPRLYVELMSDLQECAKFIRKYETGEERLSQLILQEIVYNPKISTSKIDVFVEIVTTLGRRALLAMPGGNVE